MSFNRRKRDPFGPRFGELLGKHCHAAITAASRGKREEYDRLIADIYQMLDSLESETAWPLDEYTEAADARDDLVVKETKNDEPTTVAPESKPAPARKGSKSPAKKRTKKSAKPSDGSGDTD
jgi:hypothetical protein